MSPALALVALSLTAAFEGELQLQVVATAGNATVKLTLSPKGLRSDIEGQFSKRALRSTLLVHVDAPDVGLALDPVKRTVQRFSLAEAAEATRPQRSIDWRVERLGRARVLDFECERVRVSAGPSFVAEYWVSTEPLVEGGLASIINRAGKQPASVEAALRAAGLRGLVLKMEQQNGPERVSMTLTAATSKSVPAELLKVPDDYKAIGGALGPGASLQQVAQFNTLTEEQKKALTLKLRENARR